MAITFGQAARLIGTFNKRKDEAVLRGMDSGAKVALRVVVTIYMEPLGRGKTARPPNPPPGPIGIRTGNLRRAVGLVKAVRIQGGYAVGLDVDLGKAPYGRIHELGGRTRAHVIRPVKAKVLAWKNAAGEQRFARFVHHPGSEIPKRPYLTPGLSDLRSESAVVKGIDDSLARLQREILGGG